MRGQPQKDREEEKQQSACRDEMDRRKEGRQSSEGETMDCKKSSGIWGGWYLTTGGRLYHGNHNCSCNKCVSSMFTATLRTENI